MKLQELPNTCSMLELVDVTYPNKLTRDIIKDMVIKRNNRAYLKGYAVIMNLDNQWRIKDTKAFEEQTGFKLVFEYTGFINNKVQTFILEVNKI